MLDLDFWNDELFHTYSYEEGILAVKEVILQLRILEKKIRKTVVETLEQLPQKLIRSFRKLSQTIMQAFRPATMEEYSQAAGIYGHQLAGELYDLQVRFAALRLAVIGAAAPLAELFVPVVRKALDILTGAINGFGQALRYLLFGQEAAQGFASGLSSANSAGKSLRRTLAGFDQLNRLSDGGGGAGGMFAVNTVAPLSPQWKELAQQITGLLIPLQQLDFSKAVEALKALAEAAEPLTKTVFSGLYWAWHNVLVPLARWTAEEFLPQYLNTLATILQALGQTVEALRPTFTWFWESCLQPMAQWTGGQIIAHLQGIMDELNGVGAWLVQTQTPVDRMVSSVKSFLTVLGQLCYETMGLGGVTEQATGSVNSWYDSLLLGNSTVADAVGMLRGFGAVLQSIAGEFNLMELASGTAWEGISALWGNAWSWLKEKTVDPAYAGVKSAVNGIIGVINALIRGAAAAFNLLSDIINGLNITIPDWVPVIGGKSLKFSLGTVTPPQIPYLAQGAVLPANKPFLAVVGDQKHGTNIEAPLATIEAAVASVMQDNTKVMLRGFEALLEENRLLRSVVQSMELGESAVAAAVDRYQQTMAVSRGGYL